MVKKSNNFTLGKEINDPVLLPAAIVEEPEFTEYIENVTVPAGRNVKLGCSVKNLGSYKVRMKLNILDIHMFLLS